MSKKLAAGSDGIVLDVKMGSGAFMKDLDSAVALAEKMTAIGTMAGRKCCALITNMDIPLGMEIGNSLEIIEAVQVLRGQGPEDLKEVSVELAANMLYLGGIGTIEECRAKAYGAIEDGSALETFARMVKGQGGDESLIYEPERFEKAACIEEVKAPRAGYINAMDTEAIGIASVMLGAGRDRAEDPVDYTAGITMKKTYGQKVEEGEVIALFHTSDPSLTEGARKKFLSALTISEEKPEKEKLIYARVSEEGVFFY